VVNPFDPKTVLLAKHAQHVVLIHFPIALFIAGVAFDVVGQWRKKALLAAAASYNFLVAALMTVPTVISGLLAWQWQLEGERLKGTLLQHLVLGSASSLLIWIVWWIHFRARRNQGRALPPTWRFAVEVLGAILVAVTGHLGGFLSGVNGAG
jgi:uncharacterized membrane protein